MDARWGNSGQRVKAAVAVKLEPRGRLSVIQDYQMGLMRRLPDPVGIGWTVEGTELEFESVLLGMLDLRLPRWRFHWHVPPIHDCACDMRGQARGFGKARAVTG